MPTRCHARTLRRLLPQARRALWAGLLLLAACGGGGDTTATAGAACDTTVLADSGSARPATWAAASHGKDAAADYDRVFPEHAVLRLDIAVTPCRWQAMLDDLARLTGTPPRATRATVGDTVPVGCTPVARPPSGNDITGTPLWVPVTVRFAGQEWHAVGMRFKGSSTLLRSWRAGLHKLPFRLNFDKFADVVEPVRDQRFFGFKQLSFGNHVADHSFLREKVGSDLLRAGGVPAPRAAWVRIYLDVGAGARYLGLFTMTEIPDGPMLTAWFGNKDGNLYKPEGEGANWGPRDMVSSNIFRRSFDKQSNEAAADWSDIEAAIDALNDHRRTSMPALWRDRLAQTFHVDAFLRWMAANAVMGNGDAYGFIAHNYYLYADALDAVPGRLNWISWDHDRTMACAALDIRYPEPGYPASRWPLIRHLLDDPVYAPAYLQHARLFLSGAFDAGPLQARLDAAAALVEPYVTGVHGEQIGTRWSTLDSAGQFSAAQAVLGEVSRQRHMLVPAMLP